MSGPRRRTPRKRGLSRRNFLKRAGAGAALAVATPLLPGCGHDDDTPAATGGGAPTEPVFRHGVASGDPLADRVILWTRVTAPGGGPFGVDYVIARDPLLADIVAQGQGVAEAGRDFTVKVDATGLAPATTYYYRFSALGQASPVGRTRTLPVGSVERLRIAVVSCASLGHGLFNAYRRVAERLDLDLVVHLGDYIYEYSSGEDGKEVYGTARLYEPPTEIVTLADYRLRHAQYKRDADLQALHRQHPMINVWDDHETADNSCVDGATNHAENGNDEGPWATRVGVALQAFYEWMPIRPVGTDLRQSYRTFRLGELADLVMLESRLLARQRPLQGDVQAPPPFPSAVQLFRDAGAFADEARTLLGAEQEAWLAGELRGSGAKWRLLGQQVMLGQLKVVGAPNALGTSLFLNPDQWDGYPRARDRLFQVLGGDATNAAVGNVVVLTGDIHTGWAMDLTPDPNNPAAYNPLTGDGSLAVEFVATSITSPGLPELAPLQDAIPAMDPHIKYAELSAHGYLLLDVTPERVVGEHWYVDTIDAASTVETLGAAFAVADGENRLASASATEPRADPPPPAP